ncbi:hypothetical protein Adt_35363 [Abeliophyllum distichum]|uniref:Uncharacterized protein n=1 Tax=Abeliophyllum distichum TaxID=126358 RepID=A0ABD1QEH8_9LAMI
MSSKVNTPDQPYRTCLLLSQGRYHWALQRKIIEEISHEATRKKAERVGEEEATGGEVSLMRKRKVGLQDRPKPMLKKLAGSGSSIGTTPPAPRVLPSTKEKALEAANEEKRQLKEDTPSHLLEAARLREEIEAGKAEARKLRESLENSNRRREEGEVEVAKLLGEKKLLEEKLENAEADFTANIHHTGT